MTLTDFEPAQLKLAQTPNLRKSLMWVAQIFQPLARNPERSEEQSVDIQASDRDHAFYYCEAVEVHRSG